MAAAVAATPLAYLAVRLIEAEPTQILAVLFRERTSLLTLISLALAIVVAFGCLLIGIPLAWFLTHGRLPVPGLWRVLAALPLAIPSYVSAFAWISTWPGLNGFWALAVIMILACTPYVTLPVAAALRLADRGPADAARTLGRGRVGAFAGATLPQIAPAALAGALLAALYTLSDFGSPSLLRVQTLTWAVYAAYEGGFNRTLAAATATVLVGLALALVAIERAVRRRARRGGEANVRPQPLRRTQAGATPAIAVVAMTLVAAGALGIPALALVRRGLESRATDIDWPRLAESTATTLGLSLAGAAIAVALGLPIAVLAARYRSRLVAGLESVSYLANGIPGIVIGLSLVFLTLNLAPGLYQTALALCLAYAVIFLPKAVGSARSAIEQVPTALEDVARSTGRGPLTTWFTVTARLSVPGIAAGACWWRSPP